MPDEAREPADELLALTRRVYAECAAYADNGQQTIEFETAGAPDVLRTARTLRFLTRWRRPDRFHFEFRAFGPDGEQAQEHCAVWTASTGARSWWTRQPQVAEHASLEHALGAAAALSAGTPWRIASLLGAIPAPAHWLPGGSGFRGESLEFDGAPCLRVPLLSQGDARWIWIEQGSGLVVRLDEERTLSEEELHRTQPGASRVFRARTTTLFRPQLDPGLGPEDFGFTPPRVG